MSVRMWKQRLLEMSWVAKFPFFFQRNCQRSSTGNQMPSMLNIRKHGQHKSPETAYSSPAARDCALICSMQYELAATLTQRLDLMALGFLGRGIFASGLCWLFGKLRNRPSLLIAFGRERRRNNVNSSLERVSKPTFLFHWNQNWKRPDRTAFNFNTRQGEHRQQANSECLYANRIFWLWVGLLSTRGCGCGWTMNWSALCNMSWQPLSRNGLISWLLAFLAVVCLPLACAGCSANWETVHLCWLRSGQGTKTQQCKQIIGEGFQTDFLISLESKLEEAWQDCLQLQH